MNETVVVEEAEVVAVTLYEVAFLVRTEADVASVAALLTQHGAEVVSEGPVRQLQLAYPIAKLNEAYFGYVQARMTPAAAKQMEQDVRVMPAIARMMIVVADVPKQQKPREQRPVEGAEGHAARRPAGRTIPAPTLSNEELEKALEEITA